MPRSSRGSAPRRPSAPAPAPARAPTQQQTRPMSTATAPARPGQQQGIQGQQKQAQAGSGSGLFGQMASTAAGVAIGSSVGHAIGGWFGGSSAQQPIDEQYQQPVDSYAQPGQAMDQGLYNTNASTGQAAQGPCATDIRTFTQCMEQNRGDMNICGWYLEQLRACQQAAKEY